MSEQTQNVNQQETNPAGSTSIDTGEVNSNQEDLQVKIAASEAKQQELMADLKKSQAQLKEFDGMDPAQVKRMMAIIEQDADSKLLAEGKFDEVINKRLEKKEIEYNAAIEAEKQRATQFEQLYQTKMVDDSIRQAATTAGVTPTAIEDVLLRGKQVFKVGTDGTLEARDTEGKLLTTDSGQVLTPENFIDQLKTTSPHYWPGSSGTGLRGNQNTPQGGGNNVEGLQTQLNAAAEAGNMAEVRKIRTELVKLTSGGINRPFGVV